MRKMMTNKEKFKDICNRHIKRDGITNLLSLLEKTDFYTAPASTRYHDSCEGGLVSHSIDVYNEMYQLCVTDGNIDTETIAICGLFHDICKMGFYKVSQRNVKNEFGKWIQVPYYEVDDSFPYGHGEKSVYILNDVMKLTDEEAMAIRWHMGGFTDGSDIRNVGKAFEMFPLAVYLHMADMRAVYLGGVKK
jgi:hypothetical protein